MTFEAHDPVTPTKYDQFGYETVVSVGAVINYPGFVMGFKFWIYIRVYGAYIWGWFGNRLVGFKAWIASRVYGA